MSELETRKALGRRHLNAHRIDEALEVYSAILRDYPEDLETLVFLGDCYLAGGDTDTATEVYSSALNLDVGNQEIKRRLVLAQTEAESSDLMSAESAPTDPNAIGRLLRRLHPGAIAVTEEQVEQAGELLQAILTSEQPAQEIAERLEEIEKLLPPLIELNIREAQEDGNWAMVQELQNLLMELNTQVNGATPKENVSGEGGAASVLFLTADAQSPPAYLKLSSKGLTSLGYETEIASDVPVNRLNGYQAVIVHNPHSDQSLVKALASSAGARIPVIVCLDADFEKMPLSHPDYEKLGLGSPGKAKDYQVALTLADQVCVPNETLAVSLSAQGYPVVVIPPGWTKRNPLWGKPSLQRNSINIGWFGPEDETDGIADIKRAILRVMREFPDVKLVVGGNPRIYQLFNTLDESRRIYLPPVNYEDHPHQLAQVDILLVPLRNSPFNQSKSDRRLMEAGIRRIPWVASPNPAVLAWATGGLVANTDDDWHTHLRQLILDADLRVALGQAGRERAEEREMTRLSAKWFRLLQKVI